MSTIEPGSMIGDRYELGRLLGSGGMAQVFLAYDRTLDREVAVKVLSERYASDPAFVERFRREASSAAGLNHPNIVSVFDRGETDGSYYIVMELLRGPDLKQVIRQRGPLPPVESIDYALQILAALGAAHRRDVIHRDVKPQNVMVADDGHLKVTDFGIARAGDESGMTEVGSVIGTAQYLSPEQARGEEVTAASDCYSMGIVLYEMLTGQVPFDAEKPVAVAMKQINELPQPPRALLPSIPEELNRVVMRALQKRPSARYRTSEEFAAALHEVRHALTGEGSTQIMAAPAGGTRVMPTMATVPITRRPPPPPPDPKRRRGWAPWIVGLVLVLALGIGAAWFLAGGSGPDTVAVPSVAGLSVAEAEQALVDAKFELGPRRQQASATVPAGEVIRTQPRTGQEITEGSTVSLVISTGPQKVTIPSVVGKTEDVARADLVALGLDVRVVEEESAEIDKGTVISQDPAEGQSVEADSTVVITVSSGVELVQVPNVRLMSLTEAVAAIENAGLRVGTQTDRESTREPGTVIEQSPAAGSEVEKGSSVNIVSAAQPDDLTVPSVIGQEGNEARLTLETAGFTVRSEGADPENGEPAGVVLGQEPSANQLAPAGSVVVIVVSTGVPATPAPGGLQPGAPPGQGGTPPGQGGVPPGQDDDG
jgi:eukaryotic-like serine/threonine-protein kinase